MELSAQQLVQFRFELWRIKIITDITLLGVRIILEMYFTEMKADDNVVWPAFIVILVWVRLTFLVVF